jgi:DNA repair protein RecO (recombination protein O)
VLKNTEGLVLRTIKYGETSIICTFYTKDFGLQAYLIRGARSAKKSGIKANYFQIGQFLEINVQHKPGKNLHYIKEVKLNAKHAILSQHIVKQSIAQFCSELVLRCVKEEEQNDALYSFLNTFFQRIQTLRKENLALAPIHFTVQFAAKIGFEINNNYSEKHAYFDALNGTFCQEPSTNSYTSKKDPSKLIHHCLAGNSNLSFAQSIRENALHDLIRFLKLQLDQMGEVKSIAVLHQILHGE